MITIKKRHIDIPLDDPETTRLHKQIILSTPFLKRVYEEWYKEFTDAISKNPQGHYLELGSGGGFLKQLIPDIITSDILPLEDVDKQIDAQHIPFDDASLDGIFMVNVFHHIPKPYLFLKEAERTLKPNGQIIMVEPANTFLSRIIYKRFHHEPFDEKGQLEIEAGKPLSHSNQALPYIYFIREYEWFKKNFTSLRIESIKYHTPILYLLSGGMSYYPFVPNFSFNLFKTIEKILSPFNTYFALFYTIKLIKQ